RKNSWKSNWGSSSSPFLATGLAPRALFMGATLERPRALDRDRRYSPPAEPAGPLNFRLNEDCPLYQARNRETGVYSEDSVTEPKGRGVGGSAYRVSGCTGDARRGITSGAPSGASSTSASTPKTRASSGGCNTSAGGPQAASVPSASRASRAQLRAASVR